MQQENFNSAAQMGGGSVLRICGEICSKKTSIPLRFNGANKKEGMR
jgi:hypothetical protein